MNEINAATTSANDKKIKKAESEYTVEQIRKSEKFKPYGYLLTLLDTKRKYTSEEAEKELEKLKKREVK